MKDRQAADQNAESAHEGEARTCHAKRVRDRTATEETHQAAEAVGPPTEDLCKGS